MALPSLGGPNAVPDMAAKAPQIVGQLMAKIEETEDPSVVNEESGRTGDPAFR